MGVNVGFGVFVALDAEPGGIGTRTLGEGVVSLSIGIDCVVKLGIGVDSWLEGALGRVGTSTAGAGVVSLSNGGVCVALLLVDPLEISCVSSTTVTINPTTKRKVSAKMTWHFRRLSKALK